MQGTCRSLERTYSKSRICPQRQKQVTKSLRESLVSGVSLPALVRPRQVHRESTQTMRFPVPYLPSPLLILRYAQDRQRRGTSSLLFVG